MPDPKKPVSTVPHSIRVRILNRDYSLEVTQGNEQRLREIVRFVDTKIRKFQRDHPDQSDITAPVMVALHVADELYAEREKKTGAEADLQEDIGELIGSLNAVLATGESSASRE